MRRSCIIFNLLWINLVLAVRKDEICERCIKIEECPSFAHLNKDQQQVWLEQVPCDGLQATGGPTLFGFSPVAKGDYICCPKTNIWKKDKVTGVSDTENYNTTTVKPGEILLDKRKNTQLSHQSLRLYPGQNINDNQQSAPNYPNTYPNQQNGQNGQNGPNQIYGQNGPNQIYGQNSPNQIYGQNGPNQIYGQNGPNQIYGQNGPNQIYGPNVPNQIYGQNPSYPQYPRGGNAWNYPRQPGMMTFPGQSQTLWQNPNAYPQQQQQTNPYNNYGNVNSFRPTSDDQCAAQTTLLPDPQTQCCGRDMSQTERITDLQNLLNIYAPSFRRTGPPQSTPRQQTYPTLPTKEKLSDDNNTVIDIGLDDRIAGGKETELDQFPWTVLLKMTFNFGTNISIVNCGGSLISRRYVLTAGHCVYEPGAVLIGVNVTLAEYDKTTFPRDCKYEIGRKPKCIDNVLMFAEDVIIHPQYDDDQLMNDIALIRLQGYAPYTRYIRPICLTPLDIDTDDLTNLPLAVAGWGRNGKYVSNLKQSTVVNLVPHEKCRQAYQYLSSSHLCAAGRTGEDTCKGDSGGPLMMLFRGSYYLIGVVSGKRADFPCGSTIPSLYTNVYHYVSWIASNIKN
ncbi:spaetzle-processing enzyme-like [Bicyclus anynana]|uniref:Spaetzle-processing enzyme-like n=1 Tax=Bicyclus anynana TaxID=110368 RepID=A0A6J1N0L9_BICAN|nr:spaetzle-processing enzyme-like [Bicyclus anynana]